MFQISSIRVLAALVLTVLGSFYLFLRKTPHLQKSIKRKKKLHKQTERATFFIYLRKRLKRRKYISKHALKRLKKSLIQPFAFYAL